MRKRNIINLVLSADLDRQLIPLSPIYIRGQRNTRKRVEFALSEYIARKSKQLKSVGDGKAE